jgi:hypothetical protein
MRAILSKSIKGNFPFIIINHTYSGMSGYEGKIAPMKGGGQATYLPSIILQCSKLLEKNEERKSGETDKNYYSANIIKFFTAKNREVKPYYECSIYLNMNTGKFHPYFGIFETALKYKLLNRTGKSSYQFINSDKTYKMSEAMNAKDEWEKIMPMFDEMSLKEMAYNSTSSEIEALDDAIEEIENLEGSSEETTAVADISPASSSSES